MRVVFEVVSRRQTVPYTCTCCNRKRTKVVKTEHTINPFNKNDAGIPRNRYEVRDCVAAAQVKAVAEVKAGHTCNKCKDEIVAARDAERREQRSKGSETA